MSDRELIISVAESTAAIPAATWNALSSFGRGTPDNPFVDHAFFLALEESGCAVAETGWQPRHLLAERDGEPVGLMPLFLKSHSRGEYVFDHGWADAYERAGGRYYPKLQCSVPFTPVTAPKLLVPSREPAVARALLTGAEELCGRLGASSVHATFVSDADLEAAEATGWLVREDTQFHWENRGYADFEDFLGGLQSRKRKAIRRERRDALADGLTVEWVTGSALTEAHWDAFYDFYMDTGERKWGRPYLNRDFFSRLSAAMAERIVLIMARDGEDWIAGALNFIGADTLYGRNWGCVRDVPFLHFELCYYQAIDFAIAHGLGRVEAGAQGEHKLFRGYAPKTTRSIHYLAHPGLRRAVADYLAEERRVVARNADILSTYTPFRRDGDT